MESHLLERINEACPMFTPYNYLNALHVWYHWPMLIFDNVGVPFLPCFCFLATHGGLCVLPPTGKHVWASFGYFFFPCEVGWAQSLAEQLVTALSGSYVMIPY